MQYIQYVHYGIEYSSYSLISLNGSVLVKGFNSRLSLLEVKPQEIYL